MTWTIGGVTLPYGPTKLRFNKTANKEIIPQSGDDPLQIVDGMQQNMAQLDGTIADSALTEAQIWSTYLSPILALVGTEISCSSTDGSIDGNWMLDSFEPSRESAKVYRYSLRLTKGSVNITLG